MKKTFCKYLFSYITIFSLPIFIFTFIFYNFFVSYFTDMFLQNDMNSLSRIKNNIDMQIEQMDNIKTQSLKDPGFSAYTLQQNGGSFYRVQNQIKAIKLSNKFIFDVFYYNKEVEKVYTSSGVFTLDNFYSYYQNYQNYSLDGFSEMVNKVSAPLWLPSQTLTVSDREYSVLTYFVPVHQDNTNTYSMLCFQIDVSLLHSLVSSISSNTFIKTMITDSNGALFDSVNELDSNLLSVIQQVNNNTYKEVRYNNSDVIIEKVKGDSGLTYINVLSMDSLNMSVHHFQYVYIIAVLLIVLLGSVIITLLMNYNYKPLNKLFSLATDISPADVASSDAVNYVQNTLIALSRDSSLNNKLKKELLLSKLLNNQINIEEFNIQAAALNLIFSEEYKAACIIHFPFPVTNKDDKIINQIELMLKSNFEAYAIPHPQNTVVLLISFDIAWKEMLKEKIALMKDYLDEITHGETAISIGSFRKDTAAFGHSYFEAMIASNYVAQGDAANKIIYYDNIPQKEIYRDYPNEILNSLSLSIESCDIGRIELIENIILQFINKTNSRALVSCLLYDVISITDKTLQNIENTFFNFKEKYSQLLYNSALEKEQQRVFISKIFREVITILESGNIQRSKNDINLILEYINANFCEKDFCIKQVADKFDMSNSNLSHYFKNKLVLNISDYINNLKLEKAKNLLVNTNMTIQEIVHEIGYVQVSSFMRKFKMTYGVTPTEYRISSASRRPER